MADPTEPFEVRAERLLDRVYRGLHHCPKIEKDPWVWEVNDSQGLSTYDWDTLTRLVIAAHDECLRVSLWQSGPGMIKIRVGNRTSRAPDSSINDRHPTIEQAILNYRRFARQGEYVEPPKARDLNALAAKIISDLNEMHNEAEQGAAVTVVGPMAQHRRVFALLTEGQE